MNRAAVAILVAAGCGRIGFGPVGMGDATGSDASGDGSVGDAPPFGSRWVTLSLTRGGITNSWVVVPLDITGFLAPCTESPADDNYLFMLGHPTLPYAYAIEAQLEGLALACSGPVPTAPLVPSAQRPVPRILFDAASGVGFFTNDGAGTIGVYRFETAADGTPSMVTSAPAGGNSSTLALDQPGHTLFVGCTNELDSYALDGSLGLPATYAMGLSSCAEPSDLFVSGGAILEFCMSDADIHKFARNDLSDLGPAGTVGAVTSVVALPGDRAIAARLSPAGLVDVTLHGGHPTWQDAAPLASPTVAMAASADGAVLVTARSVGPDLTELAAWQVLGSGLALVGTTQLDATVNGLAITQPGM